MAKKALQTRVDWATEAQRRKRGNSVLSVPVWQILSKARRRVLIEGPRALTEDPACFILEEPN